VNVYLHTFGCRANRYDSESVRSMLLSSGARVVDSLDEADVAVFNSCAVTAAAEADLRQHVRRAARLRPHIRSVVMGCASAVDNGRIAALPSVSHVIAGADLDAVAGALELPAAAVHGVRGPQSGARALLRIQDGCDEHCTFCVTTLARGANRSRDADALVREAAALAERHPEIVLTGIHIGHYGHDVGGSLSALVERLVREVPHVRFRLSSLEATEVDERLHELFTEPARLAPHLHAPLQSGSDRVLRRMGRHWYTAASYARAAEALVRNAPVFALGADVIAGFPGESDADHRETLALIDTLPFTYLHVFPVSILPGTSAARLAGAVPDALVRRRARELRERGIERERAHRTLRIGGSADVVVVGGAHERHGVTEDYLRVTMTEPVARGTRCDARLAGDAVRLLAVPAADSFPA
jgi:threonylcarbamoyladenosine tRNA methylthiotransferase MtaB